MTRPNDRLEQGWDWVTKGGIYQYKEDAFVAMVQILENESDAKQYKFKVRILACNGVLEPGAEVYVVHEKNFQGVYSGMIQFYRGVEYIPLPPGQPWPKALPGHEYEGLGEDK